MTALFAAGSQYATTIGACHALAETMLISSLPDGWLKCSLLCHNSVVFLTLIFQKDCKNSVFLIPGKYSWPMALFFSVKTPKDACLPDQ